MVASSAIVSSFRPLAHGKVSSTRRTMAMLSPHEIIDPLLQLHPLHSHGFDLSHSFLLSDGEPVAAEAVSLYSKVDKTGFIGFLANYVEIVIDFTHNVIKGLGVENSYGFSIILFTILSKCTLKFLSIYNLSCICVYTNYISIYTNTQLCIYTLYYIHIYIQLKL